MRPPHQEQSSWIDVQNDPLIPKCGWNYRTNYVIDDGLACPIADPACGGVNNAFVVLRRDHDRMHTHRSLTVIFHGDLALAVGSQPGQLARFTNRSQSLDQPMRQVDGKRQ